MVQKIEFVFISLFFIFLSFYIVTFFKFEKLVESSKKLSTKLLVTSKKDIELSKIQTFFFRVKKIVGIKSCLIKCLAMKLIYAYYGYQIQVICGVCIDNNSSVDGHAWAEYEGKVISDNIEDIEGYVKSFEI